jgi:AcrR family transcriptional regulator
MVAIYPPRPRNAEATKAAIMAAARGLFARGSYDTVGIREIAGEAGVDPALVSRYFGSKEDLFAAVLNRPEKIERIADLFGGDAATLAERTADMILEEPGDENTVDDFLIMLNSIASATASGMVRETILERCDRPVAAMLDGPHAEIRARMLGALIIGHIMNRAMWGELSEDPALRARVRERIVEQVRLSLSAL